jgi:hypothetical protein
MKRPAFQFYPADWRSDIALTLCGHVARGIWLEMLCVMHEGSPYGHLARNGAALTDADAAALCRVPLPAYRKAVAELEAHRVFSRAANGTIYSRRMTRDEGLREVRAQSGVLGAEHGVKGAEFGIKGGRPKEGRVVTEPPLPAQGRGVTEPPPSSSSSSSSSVTQSLLSPSAGASAPRTDKPLNGNHAKRATRLADDWRLPDEDREWAVNVHHLDPQRVVRISLGFKDYWIAKPGKDGTKLDWQATWRNWIRKEVRDA